MTYLLHECDRCKLEARAPVYFVDGRASAQDELPQGWERLASGKIICQRCSFSLDTWMRSGEDHAHA